MDNIKIRALCSTYILNLHENQKYLGSTELYVGSILNKYKSKSIYKAIMSFNIEQIDYSKLEKAILYLCVYSCRCDCSNKIMLIGSIINGELDYKNINWEYNFDINNNKEFDIEISTSKKQNYVGIDITNIIDKCNTCNPIDVKNKNMNIIIKLCEKFDNVLVGIKSSTSINPPYLDIIYKQCKTTSNYNYNELYKKFYGNSECKYYLDYDPYK